MKIFFILFFVLSFSFVAKSQSLIQIRDQFYRAQINEESADSFYSKMQNVSASASAIMIGYKGMSSFMLCNYSYNPYNKLKYFNEGKNLLDKAITMSSDNTELRFLRYTIQKNVPSFLGYSSNLVEDKQCVTKKISNEEFKMTDADLYRRIANYLSSEKS
ncbi:MAG: hypothetical protein WCI97_07835 [Bacteroidota bacterium]